jgi:DnaJ-domain-containing protein 1
LLPALLILAGLFVVLFAARVGAARRGELLRRWPAVLLAAAAIYALARGALWPAGVLAGAAALAWILWPRFGRPPPSSAARPDPAEAEARAILGVGPDAGEAEIRQAYRARMARAHPDRGGGHAEAARLTAARDRLLKKQKT